MWHGPLAGLCLPDRGWGKVKTPAVPPLSQSVPLLCPSVFAGSERCGSLAAEEEKCLEELCPGMFPSDALGLGD